MAKRVLFTMAVLVGGMLTVPAAPKASNFSEFKGAYVGRGSLKGVSEALGVVFYDFQGTFNASVTAAGRGETGKIAIQAILRAPSVATSLPFRLVYGIRAAKLDYTYTFGTPSRGRGRVNVAKRVIKYSYPLVTSSGTVTVTGSIRRVGSSGSLIIKETYPLFDADDATGVLIEIGVVSLDAILKRR